MSKNRNERDFLSENLLRTDPSSGLHQQAADTPLFSPVGQTQRSGSSHWSRFGSRSASHVSQPTVEAQSIEQHQQRQHVGQQPGFVDHPKSFDADQHGDNNVPQVAWPGRFVLALDFGTTQTGVAYSYGDVNAIGIEGIKLLRDYGRSMDNVSKVKTAISYPDSPELPTQWGTAIDHHRIAMINMKLEIQPLEERFDEMDLTLQLLQKCDFLSMQQVINNGVHNGFSLKPPEEMIQDFLQRVHECVNKSTAPILPAIKATRTPVIIVMTVPASWSPEAHVTLYRAMRKAGFNKASFPTLDETLLVSEPEAAVQFTMRKLLSEPAFTVKEDECFILCDAGGGTVDTVAFQAKSPPIGPGWVYKRITDPTSAQCGSAIVDTSFKRWLKEKVLSPEQYAQLDPANRDHNCMISPHGAEIGPMRELIKRFEARKHTFGAHDQSREGIVLDLPAPLDGISISPYVDQGALTIDHATMEDLLNSCVKKVVTLIKEQELKVKNKINRSPLKVLLVGGFGCSPFLQTQLQDALASNYMTSRQGMLLYPLEGEMSMTAVVRGAVLYGLERGRRDTVVSLKAISKSYGVVIDDQYNWLIEENDFVSTKSSRVIESHTLVINHATRGSAKFGIWSFQDQQNVIRPKTVFGSEALVELVGEVEVKTDWLKASMKKPVRWRFTVEQHHGPQTRSVSHGESNRTPDRLKVELLLASSKKETVLGLCTINIDTEQAGPFGRTSNVSAANEDKYSSYYSGPTSGFDGSRFWSSRATDGAI